MKRLFIGTIAMTLLLTGCTKMDSPSISLSETPEQISENIDLSTTEVQSTQLETYIDSFEYQANDIELSSSDGEKCKLSLPPGATIGNSSVGIIEANIDNNYVVFEMIKDVSVAKDFIQYTQNQIKEKYSDIYSEQSYELEEMIILDKEMYFAHSLTTDKTINEWYGVIPLQNNVILITFDMSMNTTELSNDEVIEMMVSYVND